MAATSSTKAADEATEESFNALLLESQSPSAAADTSAARQLLESELGTSCVVQALLRRVWTPATEAPSVRGDNAVK
eukprot:scaffold105350_cov66-Cyclotella_meneghiniana.AAC.1